jgi:hypothetical protein
MACEMDEDELVHVQQYAGFSIGDEVVSIDREWFAETIYVMNVANELRLTGETGRLEMFYSRHVTLRRFIGERELTIADIAKYENYTYIRVYNKTSEAYYWTVKSSIRRRE